MVSPSSSKTRRYHIRSVSLPSKSNPILTRIGEELNKLKSWDEHDDNEPPTSKTPQLVTINTGLTSLVDIYKCIDEILALGSTKQAFSSSHHRDEESHDEVLEQLLEGSLRLLDVSNTARELVVKLKETVRELQSMLRRRSVVRENDDNDVVVLRYVSSRKEIVKVAKGGISALRYMDDEVLLGGGGRVVDDKKREESSNMLTVVKVLRCVSLINVSVYESLLSFLAAPVVNQKPKWRLSKWSLVSRLVVVNKNIIQKRDDCSNMSLKSIEVCLNSLCASRESNTADEEHQGSLEIVQSKLEGLEVGLEEIESGLDCLFRQLVKTRACLLNLISSF